MSSETIKVVAIVTLEIPKSEMEFDPATSHYKLQPMKDYLAELGLEYLAGAMINNWSSTKLWELANRAGLALSRLISEVTSGPQPSYPAKRSDGRTNITISVCSRCGCPACTC